MKEEDSGYSEPHYSYQYDGKRYPKVIGGSILSKKLDGGSSISKSRFEEVQNFLFIYSTMFPSHFSKIDCTKNYWKDPSLDNSKHSFDLQESIGFDINTKEMSILDVERSMHIDTQKRFGINQDGTLELECNNRLYPSISNIGSEDLQLGRSLFNEASIGKSSIGVEDKLFVDHGLQDGWTYNSDSFNEVPVKDERFSDIYTSEMETLEISGPVEITNSIRSDVNQGIIEVAEWDHKLNSSTYMMNSLEWQSGRPLFNDGAINKDGIVSRTKFISEGNLLDNSTGSLSHFGEETVWDDNLNGNVLGEFNFTGLSKLMDISDKTEIGICSNGSIQLGCDNELNDSVQIAEGQGWDLNKSIEMDKIDVQSSVDIYAENINTLDAIGLMDIDTQAGFGIKQDGTVELECSNRLYPPISDIGKPLFNDVLIGKSYMGDESRLFPGHSLLDSSIKNSTIFNEEVVQGNNFSSIKGAQIFEWNEGYTVTKDGDFTFGKDKVVITELVNVLDRSQEYIKDGKFEEIEKCLNSPRGNYLIKQSNNSINAILRVENDKEINIYNIKVVQQEISGDGNHIGDQYMLIKR